MLYLSVKTIHIVAVILWVGALTTITYITSSVRLDGSQIRMAVRISDTAIGVAWLAGIVLVIMGGWYLSAWWQIKVVLVVLLSAVHTIIHRRWKDFTTTDATTDATIKIPVFVPFVVVLVTIVIVGLAVFKQPV